MLKSTCTATCSDVLLDVVTVGYDQRLTLWTVIHPSSPLLLKPTSDLNSSVVVKWVSSQIVYVSDVAALEVFQIVDEARVPTLCCVVVGEGHQLCTLLHR